MRKKAFTLVEMVIALFIIGVGLISIIGVLQYSTKLTNETKAQVVAINLAREGIETMYNIRDTNRKMFASKKEECRIANNTDPNDTNCENVSWINSLGSSFIIQPNSYSSGAYQLSPVSTALNIVETKGTGATTASSYLLCLNDTTSTRDYCSNFPSGSTATSATRYGTFRREIEMKGLYDKDSTLSGGNNLTATCTNGTACGTNTAKELRFCSKVDYVFDSVRRVELCSAMTNFAE